MKVEIGQHLYAINDIIVEVISVQKKQGITYVEARRLSDGFRYHFRLIGGYQYHFKYNDIFSDDSGGDWKVDNFFKTSPLKGQRTWAERLIREKKHKEFMEKLEKRDL